jgi:uncharacterized protein YndB with AHSA1/START domain
MAARNESNPAALENAFSVSRTYDAPRALVWKAWTELERLRQWWGPKGFTMQSCTLDLRPGGRFHYNMHGPAGAVMADMWGKLVYREVVPPERLAFVTSFSDPAGNTVRAPFSADFPLEVLSTVTFVEHDGRTTLNLRGEPVNATEAEREFYRNMFPSMQQGWKGSLDQLEGLLAQS